ncbi:MAG: XRE family transcriptional regulator [Smithellaceae bacterium]|nr:XRE family transcriptional regulator [Smithellaceae bacterium]
MAKKKTKSASLGERMKEGRDKLGLTVEDLAHETGYPLDVIKAAEEDRMVPPVALVLQLSRVLKLDMEETEEEQKASQVRKKSHKKRVDSYAYVPLTKPGSEKHLRGYLVTIDAKTDHKGVEYHHEGEEFIFVLKGELTIQVGENVSHLTKGESIHFNSALHHKLSNPAAEAAKLIVVVFVP